MEGRGGEAIKHALGLSRKLTKYIKGCWEAAALVLGQGCARTQLQDVSI